MINVMTISDVAEKLKMSKSYVYKMAEKGIIPSLKIGTCRRFTEEQIVTYLSSCNAINTAEYSKQK